MAIILQKESVVEAIPVSQTIAVPVKQQRGEDDEVELWRNFLVYGIGRHWYPHPGFPLISQDLFVFFHTTAYQYHPHLLLVPRGQVDLFSQFKEIFYQWPCVYLGWATDKDGDALDWGDKQSANFASDCPAFN